jgi:RNase H-like domain found in reverse transcriptase/Reverse transcriptase (RNA-dependent DNA polymerase)/Integrase zinc binding domain/gag-polyprotein putative aspartyl protease
MVPQDGWCAHFSDDRLDEWLAVAALDRDVILHIDGTDMYDAHTAVRHMHDIDTREHSVLLMLPAALRKHRAFTPWLSHGKTQGKATSVRHSSGSKCLHKVNTFILEMQNKVKHVHSSKNSSAHFASFDMRVAGSQVRTLLDTGATCSCLSSRFASRLGLHWTQNPNLEEIGGVGGEVSVLGRLDNTIKLGKHQVIQTFLVVQEPIAGYDCLLGQDFLRQNCGGIFFTQHSVNFALGCDASGLGQVIFSRRLIDGITSDCNREQSLPTRLQPVDEADDMNPASHSQRKKVMHDVSCGRAVGYTIIIKPVEPAGDASPPDTLPDCVQQVIDKHSQPGGTLCGTIPDHTHARAYQCHIELQEGAHPVHIRQYRLTPKEQEELEEKVDSFIKKGWIEPSNSSWSSSVLFVPKPNNKLRFCVDFRALNQRTVLDRGTIPNQTELMDGLQGAKVFSALDLASGYYQLELDEASRKYTAFPTPYGLYQWKVMPMGLTNAPAIFQRAMNEILHKHIRAKYCKVYLDDIIILSHTMEEHARHLDAVLQDLSNYNLFCQMPKCVWAREELQYLGHLVNGEGVKPDPAKVAALSKWEPPLEAVRQMELEETTELHKKSLQKQVQHECRRFLGFMNYFSRFIPRYSDVAVPLTDQTKDNAPAWTEHCTEAWNSMKTLLVNATMMYHPDFRYPFHVFSDASIRAIGGVLIQIIDGEIHPIAFTARKLIPAEVNYTTTEQEMLALVYCFAQWRCYLEGTAVILHTDHEPLTWLQTQKSLNRRQARWLEFLSRFQYEVVYVKGDENVVADALTRNLRIHEGECEQLPCENWPDSALTLQLCRAMDRERLCATAVDRVGPGNEEAQGGGDGTSRPWRQNHCLRQDASRASAVGNPGGSNDSGDRAASTATREPPTVLTFVAAGGHTRSRAVQPSRSDGVGCSRGETDGGTRGADEGVKQDLTSYSTSDAMHDYNRSGGKVRAPAITRGGRKVRAPVVAVPNNREVRAPIVGNGPSCMKRVSSDVLGEARRTRARHERSVHWADMNTEGISGRDADYPTVSSRFGEYKGLGPSSRNNGRDESNGSVPDQPPVTDSFRAGPDQSLSAYETLFEDLFTRIRKGLACDLDVLSEQSRVAIARDASLTWRDGLVWKTMNGCKKLYIPDADRLRDDILYWHHDVPWCAHLGIGKTLELVKRQFWWPRMDIDIKRYIDTCYKCQANKPDRRNRQVPLTPLVPPSACWCTIGVDMIVDLPVSEGAEYNAIIVFMCHLSKMVRIVPTHTTLDAKGMAQVFLREVFPHYGMPMEIVSDRGTQWNNEFFQALCDEIGIKLKMSTAYHPQTNGLVERTNEMIGTALRHFVSADQRDWPQYLPFIEFAFNDMYKDTIQTTAFRMNRITLPRNPFAAITQLAHGGKETGSELARWMGMSKVEDGQHTALEAHERFSWARRCIYMAKDRMKANHDKKVVSDHLYEVGQYVWLNIRNISIRHPSLRQKLLPKFIGPLKIIEVIGRSAVKLDMPAAIKVHPTISVSLVKPFMARAGTQIPPVVINGELEWEIEAILNHNVVKAKQRGKPGLVEFKVRWKGDYEDSWHELIDFENSMPTIEAYLNNVCTKHMRKAIFQTLTPEDRLRFSPSLRREMEIAGKEGETPPASRIGQ